MALYRLANPHTLPMVIELVGTQTVRASFPAIPGCEVEVTNLDPWKAREQAILDCARAIVAKMEQP